MKGTRTGSRAPGPGGGRAAHRPATGGADRPDGPIGRVRVGMFVVDANTEVVGRVERVGLGASAGPGGAADGFLTVETPGPEFPDRALRVPAAAIAGVGDDTVALRVTKGRLAERREAATGGHEAGTAPAAGGHGASTGASA